MKNTINVYGYEATPKQAREYLREHDKLLEKLNKKWEGENMTNREAVENNDVLLFEAEDCNDPMWEYVIAILSENIPGFNVGYGNGNWMAFAIPKE